MRIERSEIRDTFVSKKYEYFPIFSNFNTFCSINNSGPHSGISWVLGGGGAESVVFMALTLARSIGVAVINQSSAAANRTLRKGGGVSQSYFLAR